MSAHHYLENVAKKPIEDADFAGADVRYSPEFEALEAELAKTGSIHQSEATDWEAVREGAEALLVNASKDLRVAVWLTWSLYQQQSLAGLHAGISLLHYLCIQHWPHLHPRKTRTRAAALRWLQPRLEQALGEYSLQPGEIESVRAIAIQLRELDTQLHAQLSTDAPELLPLCRRLDGLIERSIPSEPSAANNADLVKPAPAPATPVTDSGAPASSKDAHKLLRQLQDQSRQLCSWWQQQKAGDVRGIKLARTLLWLPIDSVPEHDNDHITALRGLPADRLASYQERLGQGQFGELLQDLEASIARAPFWLDGQHLAWQCLQGLNNEAAMHELERQLASLLQRLPALETLHFHDGTPFANSETRSWISSRVLAQGLAPADADSPHTETSCTATWDAALQEALTLLRSDGLKVAVQHLKQSSQQAAGGRDRFHWKLTQARLCYHARQYELAGTQLDSLDQLLRASGLEEWEPDLSLEVLSLLHRCCERLPQQQALRERKEEIYRRLCHLDLEVVLDQAFGP